MGPYYAVLQLEWVLVTALATPRRACGLPSGVETTSSWYRCAIGPYMKSAGNRYELERNETKGVSKSLDCTACQDRNDRMLPVANISQVRIQHHPHHPIISMRDTKWLKIHHRRVSACEVAHSM